MKNSRLRKKSPVWWDGYRVGYSAGEGDVRAYEIKSGYDDATWGAYVERMKDQSPEEYLAGDVQGYRRGYSDGHDQAAKSGVSGIVVGVVVGMAAVGGFLIGFAL